MKRRTVWMASATLLVMPMAAQAYILVNTLQQPGAI